MRHHNQNRKFKREIGGRKALVRGLVVSLIHEGKINTTVARAKEIRSEVEKIITCGKKDSLASRRLVSKKLGAPETKVIQLIFSTLADKYKERNGGYTRVIKTGLTKSGRDEAYIELI